MQEHYFVERFLGVGIYAIWALGVLFSLGRKRNSYRSIFRFYTIFLTILSFFYIPAQMNDLYRLWETASMFTRLPFGDMVTAIFARWSQPLGFLYICTLCRFNIHLVPAITALIFYTNVFYIVADYSERNEIASKVVAVVTFLLLSRGLYCEVISGIRCMMAFSIVARCIYTEIYKKRSVIVHLPIYIICVFIHNTSIVAVAVYLITKALFEVRGWKRIIYVLVIGTVMVLFSRYSTGIIDATYEKAFGYLESGGYSYIWEFVFNGIYALLTIYLMYKGCNRYSISKEGLALRRTCMVFYIMCLVFVNIYSIYHRYISFVSLISLPVLLEVIDQRYKNEITENRESNTRSIVYTNILIVAMIMLFFSGIKGNLNGIRFFTF